MWELLPLILRYLPLVIKIAPDVKNAIAIGVPIFEAIRKVAPDLLPVLQRIGAAFAEQFGGNPEDHAKAIASAAFGVPGWTEKETQDWWDRATGTS